MQIIPNYFNYQVNSYNKMQSNTRRPVFKSNMSDFGKVVNLAFEKKAITDVIPADVNKIIINKLRLAIEEIINKKNLIGYGFFGEVYKIDEKLVLKIGKGHYYVAEDIADQAELGKNTFKNLKTYYGEEILKIGNIRILRNTGSHIPAGAIKSNEKGRLTEAEKVEYYVQKYLPTFSKVPQESYDDVAMDFFKLNQMRTSNGSFYEFDSNNPANVLLVGDKLKLVDEIDSSSLENQNSVGKLLEILLNKKDTFDNIDGYGESLNYAQEIFSKVIIATEKANLPYCTREKDSKVWAQLMEKLNIKSDFMTIIEDLSNIRYTNFDQASRISKIEDYLKLLFS